MTKVRHDPSYNASFKKAKKNLIALYIDTAIAKPVLSNFNKFYLFLQYNPSGIYPIFLIRSTKATGDISQSITLTPNDYTIHVGFKRQDDLLDLKGNLLSKSLSVQRTLEYIKCDNSWFKWLWYKVGLFFKA